jgi:RecA-family ATPase
VFGDADEIKRAHVRAFIAMLRKIAVRTGTAFLILAHPSAAGLGDGTLRSGSTHWTNAVRSVLMLERAPKDDVPASPDARILKFGPTNYGPACRPDLNLRWSAGAFAIDEDNPPAPPRPSTSRAEREAEIDELFLQLLDRADAAGQRLSDAPTSGKYAPRLFAKDRLAKDVSDKAFGFAMARLFTAGAIHMVPVGAPSRGIQKIVRRPPAGPADPPAGSPTGSPL